MAKHIKGQIIGHKDNGKKYELGRGAGFCDFYEGPLNMGELADNATVTIHEGPHERVLTESEVRAIADGIRLSVVEVGGYYDDDANWCPLHGVRMGSVERVFKAHGIDIDPARILSKSDPG